MIDIDASNIADIDLEQLSFSDNEDYKEEQYQYATMKLGLGSDSSKPQVSRQSIDFIDKPKAQETNIRLLQFSLNVPKIPFQQSKSEEVDLGPAFIFGA